MAGLKHLCIVLCSIAITAVVSTTTYAVTKKEIRTDHQVTLSDHSVVCVSLTLHDLSGHEILYHNVIISHFDKIVPSKHYETVFPPTYIRIRNDRSMELDNKILKPKLYNDIGYRCSRV